MAFTVTSMAISLVPRAPMCQSRPWHICITLGIQNLCLMQMSRTVVVEVDVAPLLVFTDQIRVGRVAFWICAVLKQWLKARCH